MKRRELPTGALPDSESLDRAGINTWIGITCSPCQTWPRGVVQASTRTSVHNSAGSGSGLFWANSAAAEMIPLTS